MPTHVEWGINSLQWNRSSCTAPKNPSSGEMSRGLFRRNPAGCTENYACSFQYTWLIGNVAPSYPTVQSASRDSFIAFHFYIKKPISKSHVTSRAYFRTSPPVGQVPQVVVPNADALLDEVRLVRVKFRFHTVHGLLVLTINLDKCRPHRKGRTLLST